MSNDTPVWLIALDFDQTLTDSHSKGRPWTRCCDGKFDMTEEEKEAFRRNIEKWTADNCAVAIVTRCIDTEITIYLAATFGKLLCNIKVCAPSEQDYSEVEDWGTWKRNTIYYAANEMPFVTHIIFVDDDDYNVSAVKELNVLSQLSDSNSLKGAPFGKPVFAINKPEGISYQQTYVIVNDILLNPPPQPPAGGGRRKRTMRRTRRSKKSKRTTRR